MRRLRAGWACRRQRIAAILAAQPTDGLEVGDALVIRLGRQLFERRRIDQALYDEALARFGERRLVELVSLMAQYAGTAHLLAAFEMQLPDDATPVMPDERGDGQD
jgi:4-carboxymuconolactone decarboxylase